MPRTIKNHVEGINLEELKNLAKTKEELSYNDLCKRLGLLTKSGNAKLTQLEQIGSFCKLRKLDERPKFVIENFYEGMTERDLELLSSKYSTLIRGILCEKLKEDQYLFLTNTNFMEFCGMVNHNYSVARNPDNRNYIIRTLDYNPVEFNTFVDNCYNSVLNHIIKRVIKSLENDFVIKIQPAYGYVEKVGEILVRYNVMADSDKGKQFLEICYDAAQESKVNLGQYNSPEQWQKFYRACSRMAKKRLGIEYFFSCQCIFTTKKIIKDYDNSVKKMNEKIISLLKETKALSSISLEPKMNFIQEMISFCPEHNYQALVEEAKEEEEKKKKEALELAEFLLDNGLGL